MAGTASESPQGVFDEDCTPSPQSSPEQHRSICTAYNFGDVVGTGGYATVWRAVCKVTGREVAVKEIALERLRVPSQLDLELSIAAEMRHPRVAKLFQVYTGCVSVYMVMELCTGGELFERILSDAPTGFKEDTAARYTRQALEAVSYLHANLVVHRDIKPENFLLENRTDDSQLKLVDFGLSRRYTPGTTMSTRVGTHYYIAPEVLDQAYDERCDGWSLGVVAYILVRGSPPFVGITSQEIFHNVRRGSVDFKKGRWATASSCAIELVGGLLTVKADERLPICDALGHPWVQEGRRSDSHPEDVGEVVDARDPQKVRRCGSGSSESTTAPTVGDANLHRELSECSHVP